MDPEPFATDFQVPMTQQAKKKRIRNWTAEDRALHREFEKSRREAFSESLMELTELLPTLQAESRPSKHVIVDASIAYHHAQHAKCARMNQALQSMMAERDDLLEEINNLRALCDPSTCMSRQARPIDPAVLAMLEEGKLSTADPTGHGSIEKPQADLAQTEEDSAIGYQPSEAVIPVSQGSLLGQSATPPKLAHVPQAPLENNLDSINLPGWSWEGNFKALNGMTLCPDVIDETALLWNHPPAIVTASPPHDAQPEHTANHLHLYDETTPFWTHYPDITQGTSSVDNVPLTEFDVSALLPSCSSTSNRFPPETENIDIYQMENLANSFDSDSQYIPLSAGNVLGDGPLEPSTTLCSTTN